MQVFEIDKFLKLYHTLDEQFISYLKSLTKRERTEFKTIFAKEFSFNLTYRGRPTNEAIIKVILSKYNNEIVLKTNSVSQVVHNYKQVKQFLKDYFKTQIVNK